MKWIILVQLNLNYLIWFNWLLDYLYFFKITPYLSPPSPQCCLLFLFFYCLLSLCLFSTFVSFHFISHFTLNISISFPFPLASSSSSASPYIATSPTSHSPSLFHPYLSSYALPLTLSFSSILHYLEMSLHSELY